nr:hypothetical protein [Tanacetum cinerariifolium]
HFPLSFMDQMLERLVGNEFYYFLDGFSEHSVQNKEYLENSNEIAASNSNQEKEKTPQDFDIRKQIREECCVEVCEEKKQKMENTILELVEICLQKERYCMHDNVDDLIESDLKSKLLSINLNSQHLDKKEQEVKNVVEQPAEHGTRIVESLQNFRVIHKSSISLNNMSQISSVHAVAPIFSAKEPEYSLSMGYEHLNTTSEMESDEIIKSGVKKLVTIPREYEVTSDSERESNKVPIKDDSLVFTTSTNSLFNDSNDVTSNDKESIHDVLIKESNSNLLFDNDEIYSDELESHVESNFVESLSTHDTLKFDHLEEISGPLMPIRIDNDSQREEIDIVSGTDELLPPGFKNDDLEGEIDVVEELHADNSISNSENELSDNEASDFDNPSFLRPPPEPLDAEFDFEPDAGKEILVVMNNNDELECLNPGGEIDISTNDENDDYFPFMFVI